MNDLLTHDFFNRPTVQVAKDLIGARMVFGGREVIITETEAYVGRDDPACHAARGKTPRNAPMFGRAGRSYVYLIYGMYHCLNIVTEEEGFPAAVLIRGCIDPLAPQEKMDGPGKLCRQLGITREHNDLDMTQQNGGFYVRPRECKGDTMNHCVPGEWEIKATPRIGIKQGLDKMWRFVVVT